MAQPRIFVPSPETAHALNFVANLDSKAVAYAGLVVIGEVTASALGRSIAAHLGYKACERAVAGYPRVFADKGFASIVEDSGYHHQTVRYYSATETDTALPPVGTLFEWSTKYNYPIITALSSSPSGGSSNGPANTIEICDGLLQGTRISEMHLPGYSPINGRDTSHNSRLRSLVTADLVEMIDDPNSYRIIYPTYRGHRPFALLPRLRQQAYRTFALAKAQAADKRWTNGELSTLALSSGLIEPEDVPEFNDLLTEAASLHAPGRFGGVVEKIEIKPREYRINPARRTMVADLVERVIQVDTNRRVARRYAEYALSTYRDAPQARDIMERGLTASPYGKG